MSFLDKIKAGVQAGVQAAAGTAAKLELRMNLGFGFQGENVWATVVATSAGQEVKHDGVYLDVLGTESITVKGAGPGGADVTVQTQTVAQSFKLANAGTISINATMPYHGAFQLPAGFPVSYEGPLARHEVRVRARLELSGMDPESAWLPLVVIRRPG